MTKKNSILVVDDEEIVCESCSRILSREGYLVDTITNPVEGLKKAQATEYSAILLDLKMQEMEGTEFLDQLRKANSNVPVIVITGYPTQESANSTYSLGISDYLPKPFTPNEITDSVKRAMVQGKAARRPAPSPAAPQKAPAWESGVPFRFFDEAWFQIGDDATVRVGAVLPSPATALELPRLGDMAFRGLPLATARFENGAEVVIPSPLSGKVVEVRNELAGQPGLLCGKECAGTWIARIQPTDLGEDLLFARTRNVILSCAAAGRLDAVKRLLSGLGCRVFGANGLPETFETLRAHESALLLLDAASYGAIGPDVVRQVNIAAPRTKIVVLADPSGAPEAAYRTGKIFFYAMNPFEDLEIVDILHNAFRSIDRPAVPEEVESKFLPKWVSRIHITNRMGSKVTLLSFGELLLCHKGLGRQLIGKILDHSYPIETTRGIEKCTPADSYGQARIRNEANRSDRIFILLAEDTKRTKGRLSIDAHRDLFTSLAPDEQKKLTTLAIENQDPSAPMSFDVRTTDALAEHILRKMVAR